MIKKRQELFPERKLLEQELDLISETHPLKFEDTYKMVIDKDGDFVYDYNINGATSAEISWGVKLFNRFEPRPVNPR